MIRRLALPLVALTCGATLAGMTPAAAAPALPALPTISCSGILATAVTSTGVTNSGSATCTGLATLKLTTTLDAGGLTSTATSLLPALPNVSVSIDSTVSALGVTAACSVLVNTASGATVASSCDTA